MCLVLCKRPRSGLVNVLVGAAEHLKQSLKSICDVVIVHRSCQRFVRLLASGFELIIKSIGSGGSGNDLAKILLFHVERALNKVAEVVDEVHIVSLDNRFVGDRTVGCEGHFGKGIVANTVYAKVLGKLVGMNDVALGFGHLVHTKVEPRMTEYLLRERHIESHEEDGPIDGVEAKNILTDNVYVSRPILFEVFGLLVKTLVGVITESGNVVGQRVEPNVNYVLVVKVNGNTPFERGTGNAKVLQSCLEEVVDHFLFAKLGLNEIGVFLDVLHQAICVFAHSELISFFACHVDRSAAVGTLAVFYLCFSEEGLARSAIPAFIYVFVNIALFIKALENLLNGGFVVIVGGADEVIVADVHFIPQFANFTCYAVNVCLGSDACIFRKVFNFLTVLIGARAEEYVLAAHTLIACNRVGHNCLIGVAKVGLARSIGNGCCQIEFFTHSSKFLSVPSSRMGERR